MAGRRLASACACRARAAKPVKGQMVFEFVVAALLFIAIVFFVVIMLNDTITAFTGNHYRNRMNEEAMRVSEMLVNLPGVWAGGTPTMLGLAYEWPVLNDTEIVYMAGYCDAGNEEAVAGLLGLESRGGAEGFRIVLSNASQTIVDCSTGPSYMEQAYAERFAYSNNSGLVKVGVYVW